MKPLPQSDLDSIVTRCADLWPMLEGKRLFITGGTGFIGRWMVESLSLVRPHVRYELWRRGQQIPGIYRPDYAIHLAGGEYDADQTADVIVNGTRRVLAFARQSGCQRMLNVSSWAAGRPDTVYGQSKLLAESLCNASGVPCVNVRMCSVFGPGMNLERYAIGNFIRDAVAGREPVVENPECVRNFIYVADLAVDLWQALLGKETGLLYAEGKSMAIDECARRIASNEQSEFGNNVRRTIDYYREPELCYAGPSAV